MRYAQFSRVDFFKVWRIVVAVGACQLLAGAIGHAYGDHRFRFKNFWTGGALSIPAGMVLGQIWHSSRTGGGPAKGSNGTP